MKIFDTMYTKELSQIDSSDPASTTQESNDENVHELVNEIRNESDIIEKFAISDFLKNDRVTGLFAVLVGTGTMISLLPLFLGFLLGSDWNQILLKSLLGYVTFLLILVAVLLGVIFMLFISGNIFLEFYKIIIKQDYKIIDKFLSSMIMLCFLLSFFALSFVLINVWAIKAITNFDFITSFTIGYFTLLISIVLLVSGIIVLMNPPRGANASDSWKNLTKAIVQNRRKIFAFIIILILICVLAYLLWIVFSPPVILVLKYYNDTDKNIDLNLSFNESLRNNTPTILHLRQTATKEKNIGFELYNMECRWSTTFGHFIEINSNNSDIIIHQQEVVFSDYPQCPTYEDNIFWTYDISEFGKNKPDVIIGFTMKDKNKGTLLGSNHMNLTWKDTDFLVVSNI